MLNENLFTSEYSMDEERNSYQEASGIYQGSSVQTDLSDDLLRMRELNFESALYGVNYNEDSAATAAPVAQRFSEPSFRKKSSVDNSEDKVENFFSSELNDEVADEDDEESSADFSLNLTLDELKDKLSSHIVPLEQLRPPAGVATGVDVIDDFLLWKGFPKGDLSLIAGNPGTGATSLWMSAAAQAQKQKKWVAWINSDCELMPSALLAKNIQLDKLLVVKKPAETSQLFWILQEMVSSTLFEMIGCHINENSLRSHQLQKLKKLARTYNVALVFVSHSVKMKLSSVYSLMIECQGDYFVIKRAAHRPTPFTIPGGLVHADLMSQLTTEPRKLLR